MKEAENVESLNTENNDKSIITSKEVDESLQGNEKALQEQMERAKQLLDQDTKFTDEQLKKMMEEKSSRLQNEKTIRDYADASAVANQPVNQSNNVSTAPILSNAPVEKPVIDHSNVDVKVIDNDPKPSTDISVKTVDDTKETNADNKPNKKNNKEKGGPSSFKTFLAILMFLLFFGMIWFMPEINKFIQQYRQSKMPKEVITTGNSVCKLSKTTDNFDINITATFAIVNSKVIKLTYITSTKGDQKEDHEELNKIYDDCINLKHAAGELDGVIISCSTNKGIVNNKQILDYEKLNLKEVTTAYSEAGGMFPEFRYGDNIDKVEAKMQSSGYMCSRN